MTKAILKVAGSFAVYATMSLCSAPGFAQSQTTSLQADDSLKLGRVTGCGTDPVPCSRTITIKNAAIDPVLETQDHKLLFDTVNDPPEYSYAGHYRRCNSNGTHLTSGRYCSVFQHVFDGNGVDSAQGIDPLKPGIPSPVVADYSMACTLVKKEFSTSTQMGEGNCMTFFVRQGIGAATAMLSNVATVQGFGATLESSTSNAFSNYTQPTMQVGTQIGVIDTRDTANVAGYGYIAIAAKGRLNAGVRISSEGGSWDRAFTNVVEGQENFFIDGVKGSLVSNGSGTFGNASSGNAAVLIGPGRVADGPSYLDLFASAANPTTFSTRFGRDGGENGNLTLQNNGTGHVIVTAPGGDILMFAGNAPRLAASATNVAFNGATPAAIPTLPAPVATDGSATLAQVAAAYNAVRLTLIGYGLAH